MPQTFGLPVDVSAAACSAAVDAQDAADAHLGRCQSQRMPAAAGSSADVLAGLRARVRLRKHLLQVLSYCYLSAQLALLHSWQP